MKKLLPLFAILFSFYHINAQNVGIGTVFPNASAQLDITSTSKGLLIPRLTSSQRTAIASPATGLLVYETTSSSFWYYNGSAWNQLVSVATSPWTVSGNNIYNTNSGYVGIGTATPAAKLHVADSSVVFSATGTVLAVPGNTPVIGAGRRMMWYADKAAFRAGYVSDDNWDKDSIGIYSVATGHNTISLGDYSFTANASNTPKKPGSSAMGINNIADAYNSMVLGSNNIAHTPAGFVIGRFNDTVITENNLTAPAPEHPLFIIGNGISVGNRRNALVVNQNGRMGIGTNYPAATLHVADSNVVFSAAGGIGATSPDTVPISGMGRRMMWYPRSAAFRVGYVDGTNWDKDSIGSYSFAVGNNTKAIGSSSTAMGFSTDARGFFSTATGSSTTASGYASTAMGFSTDAAGRSSTAMGEYSKASGYASTAMGYGPIARGEYSTAIGYSPDAIGNFSTAIGNSAVATGENSAAIGFGVWTRSYASLSIGRLNDSIITSSPTSWVATDPLFIIGNGTSSTRSNAITVLKNAKTGINTSSPLAMLHVADSSTVFTATGVANPTPGNPPVSGAGRRNMWYADKAAFRVGYVSGTNWDKDNIGNYSFAAGNDVLASGQQSVAFGSSSQALTAESFAIGNNAIASGLGARAMGLNVTASGDQSTAIGYNHTASGGYAVALGSVNTASGFASTATGSFTIASGDYSSANGRFTKSKSFAGTVVGIYNDSTNAASGTAINQSNRLFQIGNGTADNVRSNAMTVLQDGSTGINTSLPETNMDVNGDLALRQNVITLAGGLNSNINVGKYSFVKITGPAINFSIDGIQGGVDGKILTLYNLTGTNMTIVDQTGSASNLINRINTLEGGVAISTVANGSVTLQYSAADNRWMVIAMKE